MLAHSKFSIMKRIYRTSLCQWYDIREIIVALGFSCLWCVPVWAHTIGPNGPIPVELGSVNVPSAGSSTATTSDRTSERLPAATPSNNANSTSGIKSIYYIHTDHLNTPRVITDAQKKKVWQWRNVDPFGKNAADEQGTFVFNLRFPGQYYDRETGLHYNWHRDYDPGLGRYIKADPLNLNRKIDVYQYVDGNPISFIDSFGLEKAILFNPISELILFSGAWNSYDIPGVMTVYAHGWPGGIMGPYGERITDVDRLATVLSNFGWKPGMPVRFVSCQTGQGKDSIAEKFSKKFKVFTIAPNRFVWYSYYGYDPIPHDGKIHGPGQWINFIPAPSIIDIMSRHNFFM